MADQNIEITIKDSTSSGGGSGTPVGGSGTAKTSATPADIAKVFGKSILSGHGIMGALKDVGKISAGVAIGMTIFSAVGKGISFIVNLFRKSRIFSSFFNAFLDILMAFIDLLMVPLIPFLTSVLNVLMGWLQAYQEGGLSGLFDQIIEDAIGFIGKLPGYIWDALSNVDLATVLKGLIIGCTLLALLTPLIVGVALLTLFGPFIVGVALMALFSKFITGVSLATLFAPFVTGAAGITAAAVGLAGKLALLGVAAAGIYAAYEIWTSKAAQEGMSAISAGYEQGGIGGAISTIAAGLTGNVEAMQNATGIGNGSSADPEAWSRWTESQAGMIFQGLQNAQKNQVASKRFSDQQVTAMYRRMMGWNYDASQIPDSFQDVANKIMGTSGVQYRLGTNYVPSDMYAFLHKGERVVPAVQNTFNQNFNYNGSESAFLAGKSMANSFNENVRNILMRR